MRILAVHRFFWPDTAPYGVILRSIAARWAQDGHDVTVLSTQPSYRTGADVEPRPPRESDSRVFVRRLRLFREQGRGGVVRLVNVALWVSAIFLYAIRHGKFDAIMIGTTPPVIAAAAARYAAKLTGARLIYHCMDIHPEIGRISGEFRNTRVFKTLQRIDAANCTGANRVVVLSEDMRNALLARPRAENSMIVIINNFDTEDANSRQHTGDPGPPPLHSPLRIIFAGNLGRFQGLEAVVDAIRALDADVKFEMLFVGGGILRETLAGCIDETLRDKVRLLPYQPADVIREMIRDSDICLVSLAPEISSYAYPSKTMTYLGAGRPLLACVESDSDLARMIERENIGVVVPPADPAALARAIESLVSDRDRCAAYKMRAHEIGATLFGKQETLDRWSELIEQLRA